MKFRERVEALPIRPIGHISHGANQSLKIHLLPNAGIDRNVRSSEYLAGPAVDQCIAGQCSLFLAFFKLFFHVAVRDLPIIFLLGIPGNTPLTRPTIPAARRRRMCSSQRTMFLVSRRRSISAWFLTLSTEAAKRSSRKISLCPHAPNARQRKILQPVT